MKTDISYRHVEWPLPVEAAVEHHIAKINALLKSYEPDLVQLHGSFEKNERHSEYAFSVNLNLPTGTLHATASSPDAEASVRKGFLELETQIKKHQARLRKDYQWKRKSSRVAKALA